MNLICFAFLCIFSRIVCEEHALLDPCDKDDMDCLKKAYISFMSNAVNGIGEPLNTEPLDPLRLPEWSVPAWYDDPLKGNITFKNIVIKGFKNSRLDGFFFDTENKLLFVNVTAIWQYHSEMVYKYNDKIYNGTLDIKDAEIKGMIQYDVRFFKDDKGEDHMELNTKNVACEPLNEPLAIPNPELEEALDHDTEFVEMVKKNSEKFAQIRRNHGCNVTSMAFPKMIDAWRAATRSLPITTFFKSLNYNM